MANLRPEAVFNYFSEISKIPRGSGNEKAVSDYLVGFAKAHNLEVIQDEALNVIIKKPATKGYENAPTIILQGHMDMVCEKNSDVIHDFEKDPITFRIDGDMLYANGTTLGADNGMAVSYALAILAGNDIPHPSLEVLITTEEETGMSGALAVNPSHIKGKYLINIDSEVEGELLVSCAGGVRVVQSLPINWISCDKTMDAYSLKIKGLKGGHSGMEIIKQRANANVILGRILNDLSDNMDLYIKTVNGGAKMNAIPRESDAVILINSADSSMSESIVAKWNDILKNEFRVSDPDIIIKLEKSENNFDKVFDKATTKKAIASLVLIPNGIQSMSLDINGLVESSTNLGVVITTESDVKFESAIRSCVRTLKEKILKQCEVLAHTLGASFEASNSYPEWQYNADSKLRPIFVKVFKDIYGKEPLVNAIHAGLECGLFKEKMPYLDMISLGPDAFDVHTPNEHISISSTERVWNYLLAVLKEIK